MDLKYLLGREQQSIALSLASPSVSARAAHRAFAAAYGRLLSTGIFPSRSARDPLASSIQKSETGKAAAVGAPVPPPVLTADCVTRGDVALHVRAAKSDDEAALIALFEAVSHEDLRFRFGGTAKSIGADIVAPLLQGDRAVGITFLAFADGVLVAASTLADIEGTDTAEVALSVQARWKEKGIAWTLLDHTLAYATAHGLKKVTAFESGSDRLAINLEREMGFVVRLVSANPVELSLTKTVAAD